MRTIWYEVRRIVMVTDTELAATLALAAKESDIIIEKIHLLLLVFVQKMKQ